MDAWQHKAFIRRKMRAKDEHDRWFGEGRFKMSEQQGSTDKERALNLQQQGLAYVAVISGAAVRVAEVKEKLGIKRRTISTPPILGDWRESEALRYVADQIPKLQEHLGEIAKGTNEGDIDTAVRGLVALLLESMKPVYNIGYLADLLLEQLADEYRKDWE